MSTVPSNSAADPKSKLLRLLIEWKSFTLALSDQCTNLGGYLAVIKSVDMVCLGSVDRAGVVSNS